MDEKTARKLQRKDFSSIGWTLFVYLIIMNACVMAFVLIDTIVLAVTQLNGTQYTQEQIDTILMNNGWGYMLTILIGLVVLRLWKGKQFVRETLWTRGKPMGVGDFFCLLALTLGIQLVFSLLAGLMEALFNLFGLTLMDSVESATMTAERFSMFLYMGVGAPIAEELLFRGVVLRKLQPYGKRFAIIMSAFVFGVFHGNLVQIPYAFLVGLIFGYVALEHNILWAMVLHMINNLVLGDMLSRLTASLPEIWYNGILLAIILTCAVASLVILIVRSREIRTYRRENPVFGAYTASFFTAPGIIALLIFVLISVAVPIIVQIMENLA